MKSRTSHWLALGLLVLAVCYLVFRPKGTETGTGSPDGRQSTTNGSLHQSEGGDSQDSKATKRDRDPIHPQEQSNNDPSVEWIDDDGGLSEAVLESQGLNQAQIDAAKVVYHEISDAISENFVKNCKEEVIHDGSFIYVLKGAPELSSSLEERMRSRLREAIGSDSAGARLADQITEGMKGRALLNFGADDMVGAAYRGVSRDGKGWEDGMRINGKMPGMIDYYRKNGWPDGPNIHESGGQAVFRPIKKTE